MNQTELDHLFKHHPPTSEQLEKYAFIRDFARDFAEIINVHCPESADKSAAIRKVREAMMTANSAIANA